MNKHKRSSIKLYVYVCIIGLALFVALGTMLISYRITTKQIDKHYGIIATDNAKNFASYLDGDFIGDLREIIESDEYQKVREQAEKEDNEQLIEDYLKEQGVWTEYKTVKDKLQQYIDNVSNIRYLYIVAHGGINAESDMYLIDDYDTKLYQTGQYELREKEFKDQDLTDLAEPVKTYGEWGWLISDYAPIYDSKGNCVAIVGCDLDVTEMMHGRRVVSIMVVTIVSVITLLLILINLRIISKNVIEPLKDMTEQIQKFTIFKEMDDDNSNVIDMDFKTENELSDIYNKIKDQQLNIINFVQSINIKNEKIQRLNITSYRDALTKVGNKTAYDEKIAEINRLMQAENVDFAIIMADVNNLKQVNDTFGHEKGDSYLINCCKVLCDTFKHSSVYRIGGDEFVILAQGQDYDNRIELYNNLLKQFKGCYEQTEKPLYERYSMSLGMAENTADDTIEIMFKRADSIMYKNKVKFKQQDL